MAKTTGIMLDILNRPINEGDLVVVKGSGGPYGSAREMAVGIRVGNTIKTPGGSNRNARDKFLIVNPTPEERKIKDEILAEIGSRKMAAARKAAEPKKYAKTPGKIYKSKMHNELFLYLGNVNLEYYQDGEKTLEQSGKVYITLGYHPNKATLASLASVTREQICKKIVENGVNSWHIGELAYNIHFVKSYRVYEDEVGVVSDWDGNLDFTHKCTCTINGLKPYETGRHVFTTK